MTTASSIEEALQRAASRAWWEARLAAELKRIQEGKS